MSNSKTTVAEPGRWDGWDAKKAAALECRATGGTVDEAAKVAGVGRSTLYRWRDDPGFGAVWQDADQAGASVLEDTLQICATKAVDDPRYQTSLIFALKNRTGGRYRDRHDMRHSGSLTIEGLLDRLDAADADAE